MTIDKAIKILGKQRYSFPTEEMRVINDAFNLGIEALKRCRVLAQESRLWAKYPLPGETKD